MAETSSHSCPESSSAEEFCPPRKQSLTNHSLYLLRPVDPGGRGGAVVTEGERK